MIKLWPESELCDLYRVFSNLIPCTLFRSWTQKVWEIRHAEYSHEAYRRIITVKVYEKTGLDNHQHKATTIPYLTAP